MWRNSEVKPISQKLLIIIVNLFQKKFNARFVVLKDIINILDRLKYFVI